MMWVLDDGPLGLLARAFNPKWNWPHATLHVVETVAAGAAHDRSGRRQQLLSHNGHGGQIVRVHQVPIGSATSDVVLNYLRRAPAHATRDLGEDESIAFCMKDAPEGVFVTLDKHAAFLALSELGPGKVATPFDLWFWLLETQLITESERQSLCLATLKCDIGLPGVPLRCTTPSPP